MYFVHIYRLITLCRLSQYTEEKTFEQDRSAGMSEHIVNLRGVTENFRQQLLNSMEDGKLLDIA